MQIKQLEGLTLAAVEVAENKESIRFIVNDGRVFLMEHIQDCCESVDIEDICGDVADLVGTRILSAEEATSEEDVEGGMWTFYHISTVKGTVTLRWYGGESYYSVAVDFSEVKA